MKEYDRRTTITGMSSIVGLTDLVNDVRFDVLIAHFEGLAAGFRKRAKAAKGDEPDEVVKRLLQHADSLEIYVGSMKQTWQKIVAAYGKTW